MKNPRDVEPRPGQTALIDARRDDQHIHRFEPIGHPRQGGHRVAWQQLDLCLGFAEEAVSVLQRQRGRSVRRPEFEEIDPHVADGPYGGDKPRHLDHSQCPLTSTKAHLQKSAGLRFIHGAVDRPVAGGLGKMEEIE